MGRKKKQVVEEPIKEEQKNIEINTSSSTNFVYKGEVSITIRKNGRIVHTKTLKNTGYKPMFDFLLNCLAGNLKAQLIPNYIGLFQEDSGSTTNIRLNNPVAKNKISYNSELNVVTYNFVIPYQMISSQSGVVDKIVLYNLDNSSIINSSDGITNDDLEKYASAIITLGEQTKVNLQGLDSSSSILINWSMTIEAKQESEGE